jgi:hypothetical protein
MAAFKMVAVARAALPPTTIYCEPGAYDRPVVG